MAKLQPQEVVKHWALVLKLVVFPDWVVAEGTEKDPAPVVPDPTLALDTNASGEWAGTRKEHREESKLDCSIVAEKNINN